jgi:hypothetical protein
MQIHPLHALLVATAAIGCAADVSTMVSIDRSVLALEDGIAHDVELGSELESIRATAPFAVCVRDAGY